MILLRKSPMTQIIKDSSFIYKTKITIMSFNGTYSNESKITKLLKKLEKMSLFYKNSDLPDLFTPFEYVNNKKKIPDLSMNDVILYFIDDNGDRLLDLLDYYQDNLEILSKRKKEK